jgi:hypothetical protein
VTRRLEVTFGINGRSIYRPEKFAMKLSNKVKLELFAALIILNIILRLQAVKQEIGVDSFLIHMMTNSISEFGHANWVLDPTSLFGMYPYSDVSAVPFFLSGIHQLTVIEMGWIIILYCVFLGLLSIFTSYLMAGAIINDDLFKLFVAFSFSTSLGVLDNSTWTIPARGLFIILAPIEIYILLKCRDDIKYILPMVFMGIFLYATHHLFYFLLPVFAAFFVGLIFLKLEKYIKLIKIPEGFTPLIPCAGFFLMFSIPFLTGRFIEDSKYSPIFESYIRYAGLLAIPALGGCTYLVFKRNKSFGEWFSLLSMILLTMLIYEQTYMKIFMPIFLATFAGIGLMNIFRFKKEKYSLALISIFLLISLCFTGYYQYLHFLSSQGSNLNERYIEDSTYTAGIWMKEYVTGYAISNDMLFETRIAAASETVHFLAPHALLDFTYHFVKINLSDFNKVPITSEDFWFNVGRQLIRDVGEDSWDYLQKLEAKPQDFNITYFAENTKAAGKVIWNHGIYPSNLLHEAYNESYLLYDGGKVRVWELK